MRQLHKKGGLVLALVLVAGLLLSACGGATGVSQQDYDALKAQADAKAQEAAQAKAQAQAKEQEVAQLKSQLGKTAPTTIVQAGQLAPAPAGAQPSGWDTAESIRGGLRLVATFDSSGPDAWSAAEHPLVYITSESTDDASPAYDKNAPFFVGFHIIDAYSKQGVASFLVNKPIGQGSKISFMSHGVMTSPDGKWAYVGWGETKADGDREGYTAIVNVRTLKIDKILQLKLPIKGGISDLYYRTILHHVQSFVDWQGNDRVILMYGFGANAGPHFLLDPKNDNQVARAITFDDVHPMGHPFVTPSPDGKYLYVSMGAPWIRDGEGNRAAIAKLNLEDGSVVVIPNVGGHPIGITHTADGKYTYVVDGHHSQVAKIDNETNEVVGHSSAGVAGPYGIALNWDESLAYIVGKGEGSHNLGGVLGVIDTKSFRQARGLLHQMPIWLGGSASSVDHAILHPDPKVNELWVSNMNGWETIVLDLDTNKPIAYIPTPNGGNTHSGGFVRYNPDWSGEVMADQGGPKSKAMWDLVKAKVAAKK